MKSIVSLVVAVFATTSLFSQEISGTWQGLLNVQGTNLEIVFHVEKQIDGYTALMDSPTQGAFDVPTTKTTFQNGKLEIVVSNLAIFYQGNLNNDSIVGVFNQGGIPFPLTLTRTEKKTQLRPQEPKDPYPYEEEEVVFTNEKERIELSATLTLPKQKEKHPAVILIAGSGPNDRDETIFGHKPFWVLADHLSRNGIAVLRYDKRGVGKSEGGYFTATTQDFADDVKAALNYLKNRKEIDSSNIGLIGHSEGGIIAPMVAIESNEISFMILMAGMGVSGIELSAAQNKFIFDKTSLSETEKETLDRNLKEVYNSVINWSEYVGTNEERSKLKDKLEDLWQKLPEEIREQVSKETFIEKTIANIATPWYRHFLKINPSDYLQKLSIPVLAINGENDTQVEYKSNISAIELALIKGNNKDYKIKSYPRLNHLFQESKTGEINEYAKIEQTISPEVLSDITNWIGAQIK